MHAFDKDYRQNETIAQINFMVFIRRQFGKVGGNDTSGKQFPRLGLLNRF